MVGEQVAIILWSNGRPAGSFRRVISTRSYCPDRRGDGASSPVSRKTTVRDHAEDMKTLLDVLGERETLTAMGVSYGGPIALTLAHIDSRVERVALIASSPTLRQVGGLAKFLVKTVLMPLVFRAVYLGKLGTLEPEYPDQDAVYETPQHCETWPRSLSDR